MAKLIRPPVNLDLAVEIVPYMFSAALAYRMGQDACIRCEYSMGECGKHSNPFASNPMLSKHWIKGWHDEEQDLEEYMCYFFDGERDD